MTRPTCLECRRIRAGVVCGAWTCRTCRQAWFIYCAGTGCACDNDSAALRSIGATWPASASIGLTHSRTIRECDFVFELARRTATPGYCRQLDIRAQLTLRRLLRAETEKLDAEYGTP
jgi:hypothetical protein